VQSKRELVAKRRPNNVFIVAIVVVRLSFMTSTMNCPFVLFFGSTISCQLLSMGGFGCTSGKLHGMFLIPLALYTFLCINLILLFCFMIDAHFHIISDCFIQDILYFPSYASLPRVTCVIVFSTHTDMLSLCSNPCYASTFLRFQLFPYLGY
jgi:hypothetical protein